MIKLGSIAYITKLAGFEHTKFIQGHISHVRSDFYDTPLFIGKTVRNGMIDKDYDWYLPHSISDELPRSQLNKKCLVMPYVGSLGDLAVFEADERCHLGSNIAKIELNPDSDYSEEFIYYFIKSPWGQNALFRDVQGAVQKNITMEAIRNIELPEYSFSAQSNIVSVLKAIDSKIINNTSICSDLESMAKLIYDYWFVQFDFPDENGRPYKSSGGKMVWNKELKREIPEGWIVVYLKELTNCNQFSMSKQSTPNKIQYLDTANLTENRIDSIQELSIDDGYPSRAQRVVKPGDVLFSTVRPNQHHFGLVLNPRKNMIASSGFVIMSMKGDRKDNAWLYLTITNNSILRILESIANSSVSAYPSITPDDLANLQVAFPQDVEVMKKFSSKVMLLFQKSEMVKEENQQLASLRDFLLPMLMNGQVKVKN